VENIEYFIDADSNDLIK